MSIGTLFTFGYARLGGADDLEQLVEGYDVDTVYDIRLMPWGKHPWSGPREASDTVHGAGIGHYRWVKGLGNLNYKTDDEVVIADPDAVSVILTSLAEGKNVALMCMCWRYEDCHRMDVVRLVQKHMPDVEVVHLPTARNPGTKSGPPPAENLRFEF